MNQRQLLKKASLLLALALLVSSVGLAALAGNDLRRMLVVNCDSWVTLRGAPSTSAYTVCRVPKGAIVDGYSYNSEFTRCCYNGSWGYILNTYLSTIGANSAWSMGDHMGEKTVINCNEFVTMRTYPSTYAGVVTRVAKGETVDAYYHNSTFSYCYYNGSWGYILNDYLGNAYSYGSYARVVNCDSWVTLRSYASTTAPSLCKVPLGAYVEAYYYNAEFTRCCYNGTWGYILNTYLQG